MTAAERFDVVVVGARCAGAPLAAHLAAAGLSVALVDRFATAGETPSTHVIQAEGVACLGRIGLVDALLATGAPWIERVRMRLDGMETGAPWPTIASDPGPQLCVRRRVMDPLLLEAAEKAGAHLRLGTRVTEVVECAGRVRGIRGTRGRAQLRLDAPLVVGADGRSSTVARCVGARRYNVVANERFAYWGYYARARWEPPATLLTQRWGTDFVVACPADSGLYLVIAYPPLERLARFRTDVEASFDAVVASCPPVWEVVAGARRVERLSGVVSYESFFRESAGPGWVLVGDAGHFKDPAPGQGISDALRQAEDLARAILATEGSPIPERDRALRRWWRERDRDEMAMHWFAADMGAAGAVPAVLVEIVRRRMAEEGGPAEMFDVFNHRVAPSAVLTPPRLAVALATLLRRQGARRRVLGEVGEILREEARRRVRSRYPAYGAPG